MTAPTKTEPRTDRDSTPRAMRAGATASRLSQRWWRWRARSRRRRTFCWPVLIAVGGVGLAALAAWALFGSSWLAVQQVTVSGERSLSAQQIRSAAAVDLGTPLVRLDLGRIDRRVAALRPVASVTVHRAWPSTVAITVTERRPVATLRDQSGGWSLLDKTGVIFRHAAAKPALPVLLLASPRDPAVRRATAAVVDALPGDLLGKMRLLQARSMDSITLHLKGGDLVRWGGPEQSADKAAVLRVLLKQPARVYDVSVPSQPTTAR